MNTGIIGALRIGAASQDRRIILPEPHDPRVIDAARSIVRQRLGRVTLVGELDPEDLDFECTVFDPESLETGHPAVTHLLEFRRAKGMTPDETLAYARKPLIAAGLLVATGSGDGVVAGSIATTADVIRAGLHTLGTSAGKKMVSSFFLMELCDNRVITFADCAVVPNPDAEQLAEIAISTANSHRRLTGETPRVAMLSFSTCGSARHPDVEKVVQATEIAKKADPSLAIEGEIQFDAAFVPEIGKRKVPDSIVAGQANVFVFPDLDAGNIGYKIAERIGGATAVGPIVQGLAAPYMDLSRGCSVDDIINVACVAMLLAN